MDAFTFAQLEGPAGNVKLLGLIGHQMHFDAGLVSVPDCPMRQAVRVDRAVEFPIDPVDQVEIEPGRDP